MKTLIEIIRAEAAARGVLPFARFMELALYCPIYGYYEAQKDNVGRRGDFYTSVGTGELFGQLLAFQFAGWLDEFKIQNSKFKIVEAGAHDARLAKDILGWLQSNRPELFQHIEYLILEPSLRRQEWQRETLKPFASSVSWSTGFEEVKLKNQSTKLAGIIFSNELLDAMPVRRFGWDAARKHWFEWGVAVAGEEFTWAKIQKLEGKLPASIFQLPASFLDILPDGFTVESSPAAQHWWREAAGILGQGKLLTIDYGMTADEFFLPGRKHGTLRAYHRHQVSDNLLANVGEQDLTAHVDFSAIQTVGESVGLATESFQTQSQFLTRILTAALKDKNFSQWSTKQTRQFQTLTHPEHLGRSFRVLIQSR